MPSRRIQDDPRPRVEGSSAWRTVPRPTDWAARVAACKARDQSCRWIISADGTVCGSTENLECDHVGDPNDHDLSNLRMLCRPHHRSRTGRQGAEAKHANQAKRQRPPKLHPGIIWPGE